MKSLSDLRSDPSPILDERSIPVCLRPDVVGRIQRLTDELSRLPAPRAEDDDTPSDLPRRKMAEGIDPRAGEIYAELEAALAEMAEHEGTLKLRNVRSEGDWRRWRLANPARRGPVSHPETGEIVTPGQPGWEMDFEVARGRCNADALIDDLGTYAYAWNDEELNENDWATVLGPKVGLPDKKVAAASIIDMYEVHRDFPQMRSILSSSLMRLSAYDSPEASGSATGDSTAGSPEPSSGPTTETGTE